MANLQDFYTTGLGTSVGPNSAQERAASQQPSSNDVYNLGRNIVLAWAILFVGMAGANIVIRRLAKVG